MPDPPEIWYHHYPPQHLEVEEKGGQQVQMCTVHEALPVGQHQPLQRVNKEEYSSHQSQSITAAEAVISKAATEENNDPTDLISGSKEQTGTVSDTTRKEFEFKDKDCRSTDHASVSQDQASEFEDHAKEHTSESPDHASESEEYT